MSALITSCTNNVCVPTFQAMDKFVTWNAREVRQLNTVAIISSPLAFLAKLINKLILPLIAQAALRHQGSSEALKLKMGAYLASRSNANLTAIFNQLAPEIQHIVDRRIYDDLASIQHGGVAVIDTRHAYFGQRFREASPNHIIVKAALIKACNDRLANPALRA